MSVQLGAERATGFKRLSINLPADVFDELATLAEDSGRTMKEVIRIALGLAKVAIEETNGGNRIFIGTADGKILKQLVLPR